MAEKISELISEEYVDAKIRELGKQISEDYKGKSVHLVCILKGSIFFTCELAKRITVPVTLDFISASSYGSGTVSSGNILIKKDLDEDIAGKDVIIVEDIIDSGRTLTKLVAMLKDRNPASLEVATLLDKPERREFEMEAKYTCFTIPDEFVVGFGLDYDQKYRDLPYIGVVEIDENNENDNN
ncbi:MAG: hypoxanthine phosphoribosyltransferase [Lachnospiraceae bacterium]|nr:hypoxanthine phosphoribosyltransferase [Lachnospiraceae bacterium]